MISLVKHWPIGTLLLRAGLVCLMVVSSKSVYADDNLPLFVDIEELERHAYQIIWKTPSKGVGQVTPLIHLPAMCKVGLIESGESLYHCSASLSGEMIRFTPVNDRVATPILLKFKRYTGETLTQLFGAHETQWTVPVAETSTRVAYDYTHLGIAHIWAGTDHLLFLLCLLWIAGSTKRILLTVTGFTAAHSITLGLSALDIIRLPLRPVEAVIALSIVFLATELVKDRRSTMTWQYPIVVSSVFGLIHGLGFAAVLVEIGLPQVELYTGLLFFNLGVEIGQILFVVAVVVLIRLSKCFFISLRRQGIFKGLQVSSGYLVGGVSSLWLLQRLL